MLTLVYSASINRADAVAHAYKLGTIGRYQDVALLLRQAIYNAFKESEPLPWPPAAEDLNVNWTRFFLLNSKHFLNKLFLEMQRWIRVIR